MSIVYCVTMASFGFVCPTSSRDTDSVMVIFNVGEDKRYDMAAHFEVAGRIADRISATFKAPNELEFEKCYYPYLLFSKKRYAGENIFCALFHIMNTLARFLAIYLLVVLLDAALGFDLYRRLVHAGTGAYCKLTKRTRFERHECTARIFYSGTLWLVISMAMGLVGGYVTMNALQTKRW